MATVLLGLVMGGASAPLLADMFKCTDEGGHVTYSNAGGKSCKRLIADPVTTVPAAKGGAKQASPADFPKVGGGAQKSRDDDRRRILESELQAEQKGLDEAKKALAEMESVPLPEERTVTQRCVPTAGGGQSCSAVPSGINRAKVEERVKPQRDRVALHERNIEALKKELGNLK
jgi:hypothetical protein